MDMKNYNKRTRKKLKELAGIAHERELSGALDKLYEQFKHWKSKEIDAFELNYQVHTFHQKTGREIWKMYVNTGDEAITVARAVSLGLLTEDEVGKELFDQLEPLIGYWQDLSENDN